eukprot:4394744-Alexandrium_andersonii.AAC.1
MVGVKAAQRALVESAGAAVKDLVTQAQIEFQASVQSVAVLREQPRQEIAHLQGYVGSTQATLESLHEPWEAEFSIMRDTVRVRQTCRLNWQSRYGGPPTPYASQAS